jgi:hypothetical protein
MAAGLLLTAASTSRAENPELPQAQAPVEGESRPIVDVHAFLSQSFILTIEHDWLAPNSTRGSFDLSEGGINFTRELTDRMRMGAQLFAQLLTPAEGTYDVRLDWIYIDYRFWDWLGLRAGRNKIPFGLYNEYVDIDAARVPILLPQSIYPVTVREFLLAQTGLDAYGHVGLRSAGALDYSVYGGTIALSTLSFTFPPAVVDAVDVPYAVGGRVMWETPLDGLRIGGSTLATRAQGTFNLASIRFDVNLNQLVWVASVEYARENLVLAAEYEQRHMWFESSTVVPIPSGSAPSGYAMASYRMAPWLAASGYYSLTLDSFDKPQHPGDVQNDFAATLRFDINQYWLVKLEGHYLYGTLGLSPLLRGNADLDSLSPSWGAFLARTTATV